MNPKKKYKHYTNSFIFYWSLWQVKKDNNKENHFVEANEHFADENYHFANAKWEKPIYSFIYLFIWTLSYVEKKLKIE